MLNASGLSVSTIMSKIHYWVIGVPELVKPIRYNCVMKRVLNEIFVSKILKQRSGEILKLSVPWP